MKWIVPLLSLFVVSNADADLTTIERTIQKEPAYQTASPKYGLAVFGPDANRRVWLVHDGQTLYVDRNGNGDLTDADEKLPAGDNRTFHIGAVRAGRRMHRAVTLKVHNSRYWLDAQIDMPGLVGNSVGGRVWQFSGRMAFADTPEAAPIVHFDGPLEITLSGEQRLVAGRDNDIFLTVGTPGLGTGTTAFVAYEGLIPESALPSVEISFPPVREGDRPIRELYEIKDRC
jgi:hypothetical protein